MGALLRFPTRPQQGLRIIRETARRWAVEVVTPAPDSTVQRRFCSEREPVAYAQGFCDTTGFELLLVEHGLRDVA